MTGSHAASRFEAASKLERICVHGCCNLQDLSFAPAVARIGQFTREDADMLRNSGHSFLLSGSNHTVFTCLP